MERNSLMGATAYRDERFDALKRLYPELVRDGKLDVGALRELFGEEAISEGEMGYNLYWPGKREAKKLARKEAEGMLEPVPGDGVNEAETNNIYIEGDNLEVMRILRKSYAERVKMIYIDPPYNTGKDFIYPDNYREPVDDYLKFIGEIDEKGVSLVANPKSGGAYHRRWLGMMLPRLQLARELLAKDGVIFISIDDNEQANLKLLCDEVFGEENFVADMIWQSTVGSNTGTDIVTVTEHILVYTKNRELCKFDGNLTPEENFKFSDRYENVRGKYALDKLDSKRVGVHYSAALNYPLTMPDGSIQWPGGFAEKSTAGWNWLWSKTKVEWGVANDFIVFKKVNNKWNVYNKRYSKVDSSNKSIERTIPFSEFNFIESV